MTKPLSSEKHYFRVKKLLPYLLAVMLAAFGLLTLFLSTSIILDLFGIRAREGSYVLFVVWANFISGILYLIAAYGLWAKKKWTVKILLVSAVVLVIAFVGLTVHAVTGGPYEAKTFGALLFRTMVTVVFAAFANNMILKKKEWVDK